MHLASEVAVSKEYFCAVKFLVHPLKPALKLLRMADTNKPAMDKLYYLTRSTTAYLSQFVKDFNTTSYFDEVPQYGPTVTFDEEESSTESGSDCESTSTDASSEEIDEFQDDDHSDFENVLLGDQIISLWRKRASKLSHPYAIAAWFCSVDPNVMKDVVQAVKKNETGRLRVVVDDLIAKLLHGSTDKEVQTFQELFWDQWTDFIYQRGEYFDREKRGRIWNDSRIASGKTYEWHKYNSLPFAYQLGHIACLVTSKNLGIGAAERQWGDVKHIKRGKRAKMEIESVEKQAIIFGSACMERARNQYKEQPSNWTNEEEDFECLIEELTIEDRPDETVAPDRIFKAWTEEWELPLILKESQINESRLLSKYSGLFIFDDEDRRMYKIINQMAFLKPDDSPSKKSGKKEKKKAPRKGQYYAMAQRVDARGKVIEGDDKVNVNVWEIRNNPDFYEALISTKQPDSLHVRIEKLKNGWVYEKKKELSKKSDK